MSLIKKTLLLKLLVWVLLACNLLLLSWLDVHTGSIWGWAVTDFTDSHPFNLIDVVAIFQFVLFAITADVVMRRSVIRYNHHSKKSQIPAILVQCFTILIYAMFGLAGFILLYDHSVSNLLAASGAIGLSIGYVCRDMISDVVNSIVIQTDGLIAINDWIEVSDNGSTQYFQVVQFDRRMVTLRNRFDYLVKIPNTRFIGMSYINLSKQGEGRGSRRTLEIKLDALNHSEKVIGVLNLVLESVINTDSDFMNWQYCGIKSLESGGVTYLMAYECKPYLKPIDSNSRMMKVALRFLTAAGINTGNSMEVQTLDKYESKTSNRFYEIYEFSILRVMSHNEAMQLSKTAAVVNCFKGEQLIRQGEQADSMFLVSEGSLEVKVPGKDGNAITVATLWPGDCVGEMSLLTGAPRSADVFAKVDAVLVEIKKENIAPILESNLRLIDEISELLAKRQAHSAAMANNSTIGDLREQSQNLAKKILGFFFKGLH
ncbi:cyclic nucleotide-binding domain-containing protein [Polynucleobacter sp. MWH-Svant-W18]|uniref:cyclic nucleotide-binding domain-containing protein n=1 Tax=Polynucleobacter sp. MWH-Svant-W18 TaxID=1855909 RepID=UPI001BFD70DD|nr:cyclic nucleotide-binding domain-containing protein [Polynucleobacter sp. MWH-Svant-W18]QWD77363.1 mechanosensitive ion channel [Polynucleobacter sp. MWH-Svant-W18]